MRLYLIPQKSMSRTKQEPKEPQVHKTTLVPSITGSNCRAENFLTDLLALFHKLYVLGNFCTKTKVLLKSLMDDLLSLSVQVHQTVKKCDCTTIKDPLKIVTSLWLK